MFFQLLNDVVPTYKVTDCAGGHRAENKFKSRDILLQPRKWRHNSVVCPIISSIARLVMNSRVNFTPMMTCMFSENFLKACSKLTI